MKTCARCRLPKALSAFHRHARSADGRNSYCKACSRDSNREHRARNPEYSASRYHKTLRSNLRRRYGLTLEAVLALGAAQQWRCGVCAHSLVARKPCVDHDHQTGAVRGMLCSTCNTALGMLGDDAAGVQAAADYLARAAP